VTPSCPPHYTCTFSPKNPPHYWAHWWDGGWGIVVAILAVLALTLAISLLAYWWSEIRRRKQQFNERERERQHDLAVEEQRTMQLDACQGNPELLAMVRERQR
jgi:uncharacterized membrane protein